MKTIYAIVFSLCLTLLTTLEAANPLLVETKIAYFRPFSHILRQIYSPQMANYQLETTYPLSTQKKIWNQFHVWGSLNYIRSKGHSLGLEEKSKIRIVPLSLGLKWIWPFRDVVEDNDLQLYIGAGMRYFFVRIDNKTEFAREKVTFNGPGGVAELGGILYFTPRVFLDVFVDASFRRFSFSRKGKKLIDRNSLEVGGFSAGAGLGFTF